MAPPYATAADLADYLAGTPYPAPTGADAARVIDRAWEVIADHADGTWTLDTTEVTVDGETITVGEVFKRAICAQVEQWAEIGEDNDVAGFPRDTFMSTGISTNRLPAVLAPRAARVLRKAGLLTASPPRPAGPLVELA